MHALTVALYAIAITAAVTVIVQSARAKSAKHGYKNAKKNCFPYLTFM